MSKTLIGDSLYEQLQINGERISNNVSFKPLLKNMNPTEVFISRIPYNMYEDNLIPLFETIGAVVQFRLMMNHSGRNRGFGYIIYVNPVDAHRAIKYLNNILVSSWCRLQLVISRNTRDLWLGNVSYAMNVNTAINLILDMVDPEEIHIVNRKGYPVYLLKFLTHRDAALSRKVLMREVREFGPYARTNWDLQETPK